MRKRIASFRLSEEARRLLATDARAEHLTQTALLELLIREHARLHRPPGDEAGWIWLPGVSPSVRRRTT